MNIKPFLLAAALCVAAPAALAESSHDGHLAAPTAAAGKPATMSSGTVRKVDKGAGKITIAHGPLENLGMPGMTMAFRVGDAAMLDQVKVGDKIRFVAERVEGVFSVTKLEVAQ
ncbi:copper-binding protein [Azoarcus sp. KH32C]|uniref:copper-binding protein n=1 Tax=Azoarcus sp. KH32C TaxID=748247 RepID=UPI0002386086|nr:copper-binding protein [Azoarcus sp. KH32C]BAL26200.1 hypothetical protein AZKH_3916 [Azoarcus sp. KH32C]